MRESRSSRESCAIAQRNFENQIELASQPIPLPTIYTSKSVSLKFKSSARVSQSISQIGSASRVMVRCGRFHVSCTTINSYLACFLVYSVLLIAPAVWVYPFIAYENEWPFDLAFLFTTGMVIWCHVAIMNTSPGTLNKVSPTLFFEFSIQKISKRKTRIENFKLFNFSLHQNKYVGHTTIAGEHQ